jgi:uncharacterized membrane protein
MRNGEEEAGETGEEGVSLADHFFLLLIVGVVLVFVGVAVVLIAAVLYSGGSASAGVIIFIGPFPIVIGAGPDATWIVLISIILAVLSVVVFLFMNRRMRRFGV